MRRPRIPRGEHRAGMAGALTIFLSLLYFSDLALALMMLAAVWGGVELFRLGRSARGERR